MFSYLSRRSLERAPFSVAVSVATALAVLGAGGFMALPKAPDAMAPATTAIVTASAPTVQPVAAAKPADLNCLTKAVYYEARGESAEGQAAVAQVVLNRTHRPTYPSNVCGVVFQGVNQGGCQFSFACNGAMRRPLEPVAWTRARRVASDALGGHVMRAVGQALSFHVAALGSEGRGQIARIGGHVFFIPRKARTVAAVARDAVATVPVVVASNSETAPTGEIQ